MNRFDVQSLDLYAAAISRLEACRDSSISIPELSTLLRVKSTTLNARLRRQHITVQTVGRTNFVPGVLALQLAELHKHALIGWPTLREASEMCGVKAATIKARCEKGQLRSYPDLTKRLRVDPSELDGLHLCRRPAKPASREVRLKDTRPPTLAQGGTGKPNVVYADRAGVRRPSRPPVKRVTPNKRYQVEWTPSPSTLLPAAPIKEIQIAQSSPAPRVTPPLAAPQIKIISRKDYGLPEVETPSSLPLVPPKPPEKRVKSGEFLSYNPDKPFSIAACAVGKTVRYDDYDGTIVDIIDDPFSPRIRVRFAAHRHPLMREVLLIVGRRRLPE